MDAQANRRTAELNAESACEELRPEAQAIHTKKAPELPTQAKWRARCGVLPLPQLVRILRRCQRQVGSSREVGELGRRDWTASGFSRLRVAGRPGDGPHRHDEAFRHSVGLQVHSQRAKRPVDRQAVRAGFGSLRLQGHLFRDGW